jgi:hypothetical protein
MNKTSFRELAIALLDDENGINTNAYVLLENYAKDNDFQMKDIFEAVNAQDGRFFLPEEHGIKP